MCERPRTNEIHEHPITDANFASLSRHDAGRDCSEPYQRGAQAGVGPRRRRVWPENPGNVFPTRCSRKREECQDTLRTAAELQHGMVIQKTKPPE
jgi:hypothetical protein